MPSRISAISSVQGRIRGEDSKRSMKLQRTKERIKSEDTRGKRVRRDEGQKEDEVTKDAWEHFAEGFIRVNRKRLLEETEGGASSSIPVPK